MVGSLTGAVSSQRVTEEHEGALITVGNREVSVKAQARLTASLTRRAGTKVGLSDPVVLYGRAIAQWIKGTLGHERMLKNIIRLVNLILAFQESSLLRS